MGRLARHIPAIPSSWVVLPAQGAMSTTLLKQGLTMLEGRLVEGDGQPSAELRSLRQGFLDSLEDPRTPSAVATAHDADDVCDATTLQGDAAESQERGRSFPNRRPAKQSRRAKRSKFQEEATQADATEVPGSEDPLEAAETPEDITPWQEDPFDVVTPEEPASVEEKTLDKLAKVAAVRFEE